VLITECLPRPFSPSVEDEQHDGWDQEHDDHDHADDDDPLQRRSRRAAVLETITLETVPSA
jgi:hypothetical protein